MLCPDCGMEMYDWRDCDCGFEWSIPIGGLHHIRNSRNRARVKLNKIRKGLGLTANLQPIK